MDSKKINTLRQFYSCVEDLLDNNEVKKMKTFMQHGKTSTLKHCLSVAYLNFIICRKLHLNYRAGARGGLLHDFYLYDWHTDKKPSHAVDHAGIALNNAKRCFDINYLEEDIIKCHMFPVSKNIPKHKETLIIIFTDKIITLKEVFMRFI